VDTFDTEDSGSAEPNDGVIMMLASFVDDEKMAVRCGVGAGSFEKEGRW